MGAPSTKTEIAKMKKFLVRFASAFAIWLLLLTAVGTAEWLISRVRLAWNWFQTHFGVVLEDWLYRHPLVWLVMVGALGSFIFAVAKSSKDQS